MPRVKPGLVIPEAMVKPKTGVQSGRCSTCGVFQTEENSTRRAEKNYCFDSGCTKCTAITAHIRTLLDKSKPKLQEMLDKHLDQAKRIQVMLNTENTKPAEIAREYYASTIKYVKEE